MMRFWIREVAGWLLVVAGLAAFYAGYRLLVDAPGHYLLEAGPVFFAGFVVFRGGIHLLKVAVAARICSLAQERLRPAAGPVVRARAPAPGASAPAPGRAVRR
jgi:hypothetical protein